jgi:hypothetical protein
MSAPKSRKQIWRLFLLGDAITRTGIVPAAATAKMKRISRTTCGTVHDVHFARYAKLTAIQLHHRSYRMEPMAVREAVRLSFFPSLASLVRPHVPLAGKTTPASSGRLPSFGSDSASLRSILTELTCPASRHPLLLVLPDHQRNGLEQQYAICYEPTLSEITAAQFGGC